MAVSRHGSWIVSNLGQFLSLLLSWVLTCEEHGPVTLWTVYLFGCVCCSPIPRLRPCLSAGTGRGAVLLSVPQLRRLRGKRVQLLGPWAALTCLEWRLQVSLMEMHYFYHHNQWVTLWGYVIILFFIILLSTNFSTHEQFLPETIIAVLLPKSNFLTPLFILCKFITFDYKEELSPFFCLFIYSFLCISVDLRLIIHSTIYNLLPSLLCFGKNYEYVSCILIFDFWKLQTCKSDKESEGTVCSLLLYL